MEEIRHKLVTVGDTGVGKSSVIWSCLVCENHQVFRGGPTIGAAYFSCRIGNTRLQIWDTAGQERFRSLYGMYYRNSSFCVCVFDVSNRESFESVDRWLALFRESCPGVPYLLVANKIDSLKWVVTRQEIEEKAKSLTCGVVFTSAITGENREELRNIVKEDCDSRNTQDLKDAIQLFDPPRETYGTCQPSQCTT